MTKPVVYMIAGPNGAGKTTGAMKLLPKFLATHEFVNADEIARGLNPLNGDSQAIAAGRLMLERIDALIKVKKNFAFETTGASKVFADKLSQARRQGYRLGLVFLWLPNAEFAKSRVRKRVQLGGHNIPDEDVERRYQRGLYNLIHLYLPLVDEANIYDSTLPTTNAEDLIAGKRDQKWQIVQPALWDMIEQQAKE